MINTDSYEPIIEEICFEALYCLDALIYNNAYHDITDEEISNAIPQEKTLLLKNWKELFISANEKEWHEFHASRIRGLVELIKEGITLPPIHIEFGRNIQVYDGNHRLRAYNYVGQDRFLMEASGFIGAVPYVVKETQRLRSEGIIK